MATSTKDDNRESKKKKIEDGNTDVDPRLWHAVAGTTVQIPQVNSKIFYFPQGHAEHAYEPVHFPDDINIPYKIPCRVAAIHYMVDPDTDEVHAKLRLVPLHPSDVSFDDDAVAGVDDMSVTKNQYQSYTKTLSESDINKSGGFSCPKKCAETFFPPLDYSGKPTSQKIYLTDVQGKTWEIKHFYRGSKRHVLSTGWADFVTKKRLVSGDSLVFTRAENGDLHIGIRRCKRQKDFGFNPSSGNELRISDKVMGFGNVKAEDVIEAVKLGVNMQPFDVVYYPHVGTPEFFVKTSLVRTALETRWDCGMRFKMAFETEDSSKINWFIGTIASVQAADPAWPDSLWRLLQVTWGEPNLLTNTNRLNPWQVDISQYVPPTIPFSPILPELGLPELPTVMDGQFSVPSFPNNSQTPNVPILCSPTGMQGDMNDNCSPLKPYFQQPFNHDDATTLTTISNNPVLQMPSAIENVSCSTQPSETLDYAKLEEFLAFDQTIEIDSGNENVEKKIANYSSDLLQDLSKGSSGERLECNPENQCKKDASEGETVEIEDSGNIFDAVSASSSKEAV
ncbi:unnamed protein product [Vicia faba]|uniref:Auxin response factor n=1 Tax=Vicia faba TaxID=3906 RepID=A0AAV0YK91_VICFA|nr:unnamed protein product [Vicia faba]